MNLTQEQIDRLNMTPSRPRFSIYACIKNIWLYRKKNTSKISPEKIPDYMIDFIEYIKNIKEFSPKMLNEIENLKDSDKMILIKNYNDMIAYISIILQDESPLDLFRA